MDTSKDYYESVIRDFKTYGRGRTLEQYWIGAERTDMRKGRESLAYIHMITRSQLLLLLT